MNGVHQFIVRGDERHATPEILEKRVESWDQSIANWQPESRWDAANQRSLRWLKKRRTRARKATERVANKEKELATQERREHRLLERAFECHTTEG
jgi:hypothetical protein